MASMLFSIAALFFSDAAAQYAPTWASLDTRPLPAWYDDAKIGIFIHWGVFSVPSFGTSSGGASGEWFWWMWEGEKDPAYVDFVAQTEAPQWTYADYAPRFQAEFWNATQWAELFAASGARYVVPTSKHHEGFTNWPSATSFQWNSVDVGPHRDLIGELGAAVKAAGLTFGVYHSLFEWFNPLFLEDQAAGFHANISTSQFLQKTFGELRDLIERYQPQLIWSDGDWMAPDLYWDAPQNFLQWLVNDSPVKDTVVFNDRWGQGDTCKHGSYWTCADRYLPSSTQGRKWENVRLPTESPAKARAARTHTRAFPYRPFAGFHHRQGLMGVSAQRGLHRLLNCFGGCAYRDWHRGPGRQRTHQRGTLARWHH